MPCWSGVIKHEGLWWLHAGRAEEGEGMKKPGVYMGKAPVLCQQMSIPHSQCVHFQFPASGHKLVLGPQKPNHACMMLLLLLQLSTPHQPPGFTVLVPEHGSSLPELPCSPGRAALLPCSGRQAPARSASTSVSVQSTRHMTSATAPIANSKASSQQPVPPIAAAVHLVPAGAFVTHASGHIAWSCS